MFAFGCADMIFDSVFDLVCLVLVGVGVCLAPTQANLHCLTSIVRIFLKGRCMHAWQMQEAKARLSEVVKCAESEGPQNITLHG